MNPVQPTGPDALAATLLLTRPGPTTSAWRVGQLLRAMAVDTASGGQARLQIGNQTVVAQTPLPLRAGQTLTLEVVALGRQPLLRVANLVDNSPLTQGIRQSLPRQQSLAPLLANLTALAEQPAAPLPAPVRDMVRTLVQQLPDTAQVRTPEGLRRALESSGTFLEAHLAAIAGDSGRNPAAADTLQVDLKANLLRILERVRNWPGAGARSTPRPTAGDQPAAASAEAAPAAPPRQGATGQPVDTRTAAGRPLPAATAAEEPPAAPGRPLPAAAARTAFAPPLPGVAREVPAEAPPTPARTPAGPDVRAGVSTQTQGTEPPAGPRPPPTASPPLRGLEPQPQRTPPATLAQLPDPAHLKAALQGQLEAALARVRLNQFGCIPQPGSERTPEWLLELPIRQDQGTDVWGLRIRRDAPQERAGGPAPAPTWSVTLAFDLPGLGPLQARINVAGDHVSTHFWADQPATTDLFRTHLAELQGRLEAAGLAVDSLAAHPGGLPATGGRGTGPTLLDEQA